ncbi:MAG: sensor histidine kinase [Rudaea sp.]
MATVPDAVNKSRAQLQEKLQELMQKQREIVARLMTGQSHFKQLARSVWRVQEQERRSLARDLHDGIGQNLSAVVNLIDQAIVQRECVCEELNKARALVETTLQETRAMSRLLRPQILDDLGIESALRWLARTISETHSLQIEINIEQPVPTLNGDLSTLIFRLTQEALHNCVKHARASHVEIKLLARESLLQLTVCDDGIGCDMRTALGAGSGSQSSGLGGMRDRVALYDGEIAFRSTPGKGMTVDVLVPLPGASDTVAA